MRTAFDVEYCRKSMLQCREKMIQEQLDKGKSRIYAEVYYGYYVDEFDQHRLGKHHGFAPDYDAHNFAEWHAEEAAQLYEVTYAQVGNNIIRIFDMLSEKQKLYGKKLISTPREPSDPLTLDELCLQAMEFEIDIWAELTNLPKVDFFKTKSSEVYHLSTEPFMGDALRIYWDGNPVPRRRREREHATIRRQHGLVSEIRDAVATAVVDDYYDAIHTATKHTVVLQMENRDDEFLESESHEDKVRILNEALASHEEKIRAYEERKQKQANET